LCVPLIVPVTEPLIKQPPEPLLVYESEVPVGGAEAQEMVMLDVAANVACAAGETVMVREAVDVRPHSSVNDHDSV
jgi:hypothetical protein